MKIYEQQVFKVHDFMKSFHYDEILYFQKSSYNRLIFENKGPGVTVIETEEGYEVRQDRDLVVTFIDEDQAFVYANNLT